MTDQQQPPTLQESAITWELIAEASKSESTAVHAMILKRFDQLQAEASATSATSSTSFTSSTSAETDKPAVKMHSHYLSYPPQDIKRLLTTVKVHHMMKGYDGLEWSEEYLEVMGAFDKKRKKSKKHNKKKNTSGTLAAATDPKAAAKLSSRDRIRQQQVRTLADQAGEYFDKSTRTQLRNDFHSQVIEVVVLYYVYVTHYSLRERVVATFIDAVFSLRDALRCFREALHPAVLHITETFLAHITPQFPWTTFLQHYTHVLIKTHFKKRFQKAMQPFPEQEALIQHIHREPYSLFVLPWGVGTGKTAMLPPLATYYHRDHHYQTLYCVPFGPVRDQSAALLYRCGIPFAYVVQSAPGKRKEAWELQPSYHCGNGKMPEVLIVDPAFVRYYTTYWRQYELLMDGADAEELDAHENPPDIHLPNYKRRYTHLSHRLWNPQWVLMLDEPCEESDDVQWVLHNLPPVAFVMSATSWELVDDSVKQLFQEHHTRVVHDESEYDSEHESEHHIVPSCITVPANTIGVSTTLVGYWLDGDPILSPFHGIRTRQAFLQKLAYIRDKVLWKRFLSADVLYDWVVRFRKMDLSVPGLRLSVAFDLTTVTFDSICERVLTICDQWAACDALDDAFYASFFGFGTPKPPFPTHPLLHLLTAESARFLGGCIVGTPTVYATYKTLQPLLEGFPTLDEMQKRIDVHRKDIVQQLANLKKMPVTKKDDQLKKMEKFREIECKKQTSLPIPDELIVNTPEYLKAHHQPIPSIRDGPVPFLRVQDLLERGDPVNGLDDWQLRPDTMEGNFCVTHEDALQWRWKGVGSILDHKEFNMKNITDLDRGYLGFMLLDKLGAQGLNLKIRHGILMRGEDGRMLPVSTCLQVAGRVGRWGQEGTGYVYVLDEEQFTWVFG